MAEIDAMTTQAALIEAALRLIVEHPDTPAGSVLRCYSRMVRTTRRTGTPISQLPTEAEALASQVLTARHRPGVARASVRVSRRPPRSQRELYGVSA
jgi:hypothetical protein